ncbi:EpsG family protein [Paenibacillus sp. sgz500958]|uniref:EpsG family protein n=1 Tax=Paenibacillus sp. sgz500958 TaxID=3242475 RepID=UPI0036D3F61A
MEIIWLTLVASFLFAFFARYFSVSVPGSFITIRPNAFMAALAAVTIIICSGLRNNIGDTVFYIHSYIINDFTWQETLNSEDFGFNVLQKLLKMISDDPQILILVTALITNALLIRLLYQYSRMFELGLFLYFTSGAFIVSMNGVRQYFTASIVYAAIGYLLKGNRNRYIAVILFASLFHQSVLIMIPIYFIVRRKAWTGTTFALLGLAIAIVFGFHQFSTLLFETIKDTQYGDYSSFTEGGANIIRVLFYAFPIVLAYFGRHQLRELSPKIDIFVNLSLIGLALMIISTQNWIFARLAIYFSMYQIILTTWLVNIFREKDRKLVYYIIMIVYLLYFFYENVLVLNIQYRSDYLTWIW